MSNDSIPTVEYRSLDFMGYEGYRVGDDGSVWSRRRGGGWSAWKKLKRTKNKYGYCVVGLYNEESILKSHRVSNLVLLAFVGPRPENMQCCHWDGDRTNDALSNLRWDTPKANNADKRRHGTTLRGSLIGNSKLTEEIVAQIKLRCAAGELHAVIANDVGVTRTMIGYIAKRKWWRHVSDGN